MRKLLRRLAYLIRQRQFDADLAEEMEFHREMKQRELEEHGTAPTAAAVAARRALGSVAVAHDQAHDVWIWPWLQDASQDLRFAVRLLVRDRWFTLAAVVALALGISVTTTVFAVVNGILLRGLPSDDSDRIVSLGTRDVRNRNRGVSHLDYQDWRDATRVFAGIAAFSDTTMNISEEGLAPERFQGTYISANAFRLLGERPILGRDFVLEDDRPGAPAVVILGNGAWSHRYRNDSTVIGRVIRINGVPSTVIGIMPAGFQFPYNADVWQPLAQIPGLMGQQRDARLLGAFGRLRDRVTLTQAQTELDSISARLSHDYPEANSNIQPTVDAFTRRYIGWQIELMFAAMVGAVSFVLLIACANVANLLLARSSERSQEMSIRGSLGATRWRIIRQLLVESLSLAILAGLVGLGLSIVAVRLFTIVADEIGRPYWMQFTIDGRVFAFLAVVCIGTVMIFGLVPALHISKANVIDVLKQGGRTGSRGLRTRRWTNALVIAEMALTLVLLAGAGFLMRSFITLYSTDLAIDTSQLMTMRLVLAAEKYPTPERRLDFYARLEERLSAIPVISAATIASTTPFGGAPLRNLAIDGRSFVTGDTPSVAAVTIGTLYFDVLGLRLVRGRAFTDRSDGTAGHEMAIVDERFVATYFPGVDPVGHRIRLTNVSASDATPWLMIVGVSPTVRQRTESSIPVVYLPHRMQPGPATTVIVRGRSEPAAIISLLREEVRALDADLPLFDIMPMDQLLRQSQWPQRVFATMVVMFASIALVLSAVGLYAVTSYSVTQRTHEIGIRMALGAQAGQVWALVLRRVMVQLATGITLGLAGAMVVGQLLRGVTSQTGPFDVITLASVALLLVLVSLAACFVPARRATHLDPVMALRCE